MTKGRAALKLVVVLFWTMGSLMLLGIGALLFFALPSWKTRWRQLVVQGWAKGVAVAIGMRRITKAPRPRAPFFLVSNHLSYLDAVLLHSVARGGVFIARHDMRTWPGLGFMAQVSGTIWLNRTSRRDAARALQAIDGAIGRGDGVFVFPEGTTSSGSGLLPMKPALLEWAVQSQFPVRYAAITYRLRKPQNGVPARDALCWGSDIGFGPHVWGVLQLRSFEAQVSFGPEPVSGGTRAELLEQVRHGIEEYFEAVA